MSEGTFGLTRNKIIRFAVILLCSFALLIFCTTRIIYRYYHYSEDKQIQIRHYSSVSWSLHEIAVYAVNTQRSSLNLLIYRGDPTEEHNVQASVQRNRDSLSRQVDLLRGQEGLQEDLFRRIESAASDYIQKNKEFCTIANDSTQLSKAADYNEQVMRPTLRKLSDLSRETGKALTIHIQSLTSEKINFLHMWEFWALLIVALPYLYFLIRFLHLFIKLLISDRFL